MNCNKFLANLWDNQVAKLKDMEWEKILQTEENNLLSEMEIEYFSTRQNRNTAASGERDTQISNGIISKRKSKYVNVHMDEIIDFYQRRN